MDGDIPLTADGDALSNPAEARTKMIQASTVTVLRGSDTVSISIPEKFIFALDEESKREDNVIKFMTYRIPTRIIQVTNGEGAAKAGVEVNDEIIALNDTLTPDLFTFQKHLAGHENQTVNITLLRANAAGVKDTLHLPVTLSSASKMGVGLDLDPASFFKYEEKKYGFFESIPRGIELGVNRLTSYVSSMKLVFTKEGAQSIGGFGAIGSIFPDKWDWLAFWNIAAFLSVALAFMNILPIPALDGGHVLFLLYEVITRRQPSLKFMEYAQMVGMAILFLLLLYANGMDIVRLFK
jgi:regulator of sigma E protease